MVDSVLRLPPPLTRGYLLRNRVCPEYWTASGLLVVAASAEPDPAVLSDLGVCYDTEVEVVREVSGPEFEALVERFTAGAGGVEPDRLEAGGSTKVTDVRNLINEAPVVRYVNLLLQDALEARASDIHLETTSVGATVRFRVDGVLADGLEPLPDLHHAVVSRIKLLADLDIAERRRPQDGRLRIRVESGEVDLRVSTVPTLHGESVVLRLLTEGARPVSLEELALGPRDAHALRSAVAQQQGLVLVTGPTGSGKTTTLYAATRIRADGTEKVVTVEEPVEYQLPGVTQTPVHRATGVTFASTLRSLLRQDPDVILVGETRDAETASIAVQAALTGHLVLTSLHTNDAPSAIPRLLDLGVPPFLLTATLSLVVAQRLVRRICSHCAEARPAGGEERLLLGRETVELIRGRGCAVCRDTGFSGRIALFEVLAMDDAVRRAATEGGELAMIRAAAREGGHEPMWNDGIRKVRAGFTTLEEVSRATLA